MGILEKWIANNVVAMGKKPERRLLSPPNTINDAAVVTATERWRQSKNFPEEGNARFWLFAVDLRSAGMNLKQIKGKLIEEYPHAQTPKKRKGKIPSIMKILRESWPKAA